MQNAVRARGPIGEIETVAACNCDRWGHPCSGCVERIAQPAPELPISMPAKKWVKTCEYLIVFSVVAMMTAYVWILARCLQHG